MPGRPWRAGLGGLEVTGEDRSGRRRLWTLVALVAFGVLGSVSAALLAYRFGPAPPTIESRPYQVAGVHAAPDRRGVSASDGSGASQPGTTERDSEATDDSDMLVKGREAYMVYCASCHDEDGSGDPRAGGPPLNGDDDSWLIPEAQFALFARRGGILMPAVGESLSDEEVAAIFAYVEQWWTPEQRAERESRVESQPRP